MGWMAALADPTRLRLLRLLDQHELGVAELCEVLQLPQSTVSRHLKTLLDGGWLVHRREGTGGLYRLVQDELGPARRELWGVARTQSDAWPTADQDALRLRQTLAGRLHAGGFFAGVATDWDAIRREQYGTGFDAAAGFALLSGESVVADFGCGTGELASRLADFAGEVIGVDDSPEMLAAAKRRLADRNNVTLRRGLLSAVPIETGTCDVAFCVLALCYVPDPAAAIAEMRRVLRPGGRGVLIDVLAHDRDDFRRRMGQQHRGFAAATIEAWLTDGGFADARVTPMAPEPEAAGPALFVAAGAASG